MHAHGWAHLDIKIDNVMISSSDEATLIDFGMASRSTPGSDEIEGKGTLLYMAPEVLKVYLGRARSGGRGDMKKVDVFAYGCLLWAMLSGKTPWEDEMERFEEDVEAFQSHVQELVLRGRSLPITDSSWPHEHVAAMRWCLVSDYKERPNIRDIYPEGGGGGYRAARTRRKFRNEDLKAAAKEWCTDEQTAQAKYGHISEWDVSKVTSMKRLFNAGILGVGEAAKWFNADLSRWDVSNVTAMELMFCGAGFFNCNLSSWNVEKVTTMQQMFWGAWAFNKNTIKGWQLKGKVTWGMFGKGGAGCRIWTRN
ncbi:hypothetical protein TrLO_g9866 [Triparma laevis f. longispina]|uniref:Protein kinase domain-containing protein n=1 Tax=Triparma laevis f. longispina TaxID=1714387 RepID=A0A9W7FDU5_9STRA|nr:hypothetical protein TrLO_g9866 [Triparma laevis f. longispina]